MWLKRFIDGLHPWQGLVFWLLLLVVPELQARNLVVLSQDRAIYRDVAREVAQHYSGSLQVTTMSQLKAAPNLLASRTDITVAVGAAATEYLLQVLPVSRRLLATFLPESSWRRLSEQYGSRWPRRDRLSAIYVDQPLERQLALARLIMPAARTVGTVVGQATQPRLGKLAEVARKYQFELVHRSLAQLDNPVKRLQPLIQRSDIFIPLPDQAVFNRTTAKWILYIAYRQRVPLIGFSRKYVEAGAVAAVYSSPQQLGRQGGEFLQRYNVSAGPLPKAQFPRYYSVISNRVAARSLQLLLPSDAELSRQLKEQVR